MSRTFDMPELAESVVEGEIVAWLVAEGDRVAEDQPLVEVMTDKVTVEIPSPFAGVLEKRLAAEGDVVPVGGPLARFAEVGEGAGDEVGEEAGGSAGAGSGGEAADGSNRGGGPGGAAAPGDDGSGAAAAGATPSASAGERAEATPDAARGPYGGSGGDAGGEEDEGESLTLFKAGPEVDEGPLPRVRKPDRSGGDRRAGAHADTSAGASPGASPGAASPKTPRGPWGRPLAVPAARKRARELGVPIEAIAGSGPHGRVRVHDVEAHRQGGARGMAGAVRDGASRPSYGGSPLRAAPDAPAETREPLRGLRRVIAQRMMESHLDTVRTLHVDEADVSRLVELRARLKGRAEARGVSLSYLPFVMRAVVHALGSFPMLNASLDDEAGEIVRYRDVHLGLAVATEAGLVVPVVRDASRRSLLDLAAEASRLAAAAREGRLSGEEVRGGTFSVTNIGSIGGLFSFPIIHAPQAAILGVHQIKKRPVVLEDDSIVARNMLYLSLSFDHRLVDGAEAALFTRHLIDLLEDPEVMLLDA